MDGILEALFGTNKEKTEEQKAMEKMTKLLNDAADVVGERLK